MKFAPRKSVSLIGLLLLGLMLGGCKEESSQSRRDTAGLDYSQLAAPEVVSSFVVTEYFGLGACVWHGNLYPGEFLIETREEFAVKDPVLDEILRRYFIDDDWRCTRQ